MQKFFRLYIILLFPIFFGKLLLEKIFGRSSVTVLILHDVLKSEYKKLNKLIKFLNNFFEFITPFELEQYIQGTKKLRGPNFLISFDDGFKSSGEVTRHVLDPLSIKAVFFVCSGFIAAKDNEISDFIKNKFFECEQDEKLDTLERLPLRIEDLKKLKENGHLIGAHTVNHAVLSKLSLEEVSKELVQCKAYLEENLQDCIDWFAYPFGGIDYISEASVNEIGKHYKYNFSGIRGAVVADSNWLSLPRSSVNLKENFLMQLSLLFGATNFIHKKKNDKLKNYVKQR